MRAAPNPFEQFLKDIQAMPQVKERVRGKSSAEARSIVSQIINAGLGKLDQLDDETLIERLQIESRMVANADEQICASYAINVVKPQDLLNSLRKLPKEDSQRWFAQMRAAIEVEVGARPAHLRTPLTQQQVDGAYGEIVSALSKDEGQQLVQRLASLRRLAPADACRTIRSFFTLLVKANHPVQITMARVWRW